MYTNVWEEEESKGYRKWKGRDTFDLRGSILSTINSFDFWGATIRQTSPSIVFSSHRIVTRTLCVSRFNFPLSVSSATIVSSSSRVVLSSFPFSNPFKIFFFEISLIFAGDFVFQDAGKRFQVRGGDGVGGRALRSPCLEDEEDEKRADGEADKEDKSAIGREGFTVLSHLLSLFLSLSLSLSLFLSWAFFSHTFHLAPIVGIGPYILRRSFLSFSLSWLYPLSCLFLFLSLSPLFSLFLQLFVQESMSEKQSADKVQLRVIGAGYGRTGTKSLMLALETLGWTEAKISAAFRISSLPISHLFHFASQASTLITCLK